MKNILCFLLLCLLLIQQSCAQNPSPQTKVILKQNTAEKVDLSEEEWKKKLSPEQYYVLREKGTEAKFSGEFVFTKDKGTYTCAGCGEQLFTDEMKFESHCGWPSFGKTDTLTLAGGCFWCIEAIFEELKGVKSVQSGYSGGITQNPNYKQVCGGTTGHAEAVEIVYDPNTITMEELLEVFFTLHDPTTLNQQGADVGTQYRSAIFYRNEAQKNIAKNVIASLNANKVFKSPIVTEITKFKKFYLAENYHQEYYELNKEEPYCNVVIKPKMDKLHKVFQNKLKQP